MIRPILLVHKIRVGSDPKIRAYTPTQPSIRVLLVGL